MSALIVGVILLASPVSPLFLQPSWLFFGPARAEEKAGPARGAPTTRVGLVETTRVSLTLLDVEVADKNGKPLRGLGKEDFHVSLNGKDWPLYSVDDLCSCEPPSGGEAKREAATSSSGVTPVTPMRVAGPSADRAAEPHAPGSPTSESPASPGPEAARIQEAASDLRFILYMDFSQIDTAGRFRAFKEARRWIGEVKRPGDLVAILVRSEAAGLREIASFSSDPGELNQALDSAQIDPSLQDAWPDTLELRHDECETSEFICEAYAREEYWRSAHSFQALQDFLASLEEVPGRKALILFNTQGGLFPGRLYPMYPRLGGAVGDHIRLLEKVGAEATLSRTTVHTAFVGDGDNVAFGWAVNLGANLADRTGGTYNRGLSDLSSLTSQVRARCACIYRLGLEPPEEGAHGRIYQARVEVRGRPLDFRYSVQFLNDTDRWLRKALAVLRNPEGAKGLSVGAALVPVRASSGLWDLSIQLALDVDSVEFVPMAGGQGGASGSWEAGALLVRQEDDKEWEMMSVSSARRARVQPPPTQTPPAEQMLLTGHMPPAEQMPPTGQMPPTEKTPRPEQMPPAEQILPTGQMPLAEKTPLAGQTSPTEKPPTEKPPAAERARAADGTQPSQRIGDVVLHEHLLKGIKPGTYEIRAFARDRAASTLGGAKTHLVLPTPGKAALAGPVLLLASRRHLTAPLPIFEKTSTSEVRLTAPQTGSIPPLGRSIRRGVPLEAWTWICPAHAGAPEALMPALTRFVSRAGKPLFRLEKPAVEPAGDCLRIADRIETEPLDPGIYTYTLEYRPAGSAHMASASATFTIEPAPSGRPTAEQKSAPVSEP